MENFVEKQLRNATLQKTSCYLNVPESKILQLAATFEGDQFYFYRYQIKGYLVPLKSIPKFQ
jgi:CRISPR/Cas system-associated protein Csm6